MLSYCRMRGTNGAWIGCEVVFTVVYDVLVGCTSIYRRGLKSQSMSRKCPEASALLTLLSRSSDRGASNPAFVFYITS